MSSFKFEEKLSYLNHTNTEDLVCPYCGHEQGDSWEYGDGDEEETECGNCERTFYYGTEPHRTFTSITEASHEENEKRRKEALEEAIAAVERLKAKEASAK